MIVYYAMPTISLLSYTHKSKTMNDLNEVADFYNCDNRTNVREVFAPEVVKDLKPTAVRPYMHYCLMPYKMGEVEIRSDGFRMINMFLDVNNMHYKYTLIRPVQITGDADNKWPICVVMFDKAFTYINGRQACFLLANSSEEVEPNIFSIEKSHALNAQITHYVMSRFDTARESRQHINPDEYYKRFMDAIKE